MATKYAKNKKALQLLRGRMMGAALPELQPGQPYYYKLRNFLYVG